jgi:hypothetical protein
MKICLAVLSFFVTSEQADRQIGVTKLKDVPSVENEPNRTLTERVICKSNGLNISEWMKQWRFPAVVSVFGFNLHTDNYVFRCSVTAGLCTEVGGGGVGQLFQCHTNYTRRWPMEQIDCTQFLSVILRLGGREEQNFALWYQSISFPYLLP